VYALGSALPIQQANQVAIRDECSNRLVMAEDDETLASCQPRGDRSKVLPEVSHADVGWRTCAHELLRPFACVGRQTTRPPRARRNHGETPREVGPGASERNDRRSRRSVRPPLQTGGRALPRRCRRDQLLKRCIPPAKTVAPGNSHPARHLRRRQPQDVQQDEYLPIKGLEAAEPAPQHEALIQAVQEPWPEHLVPAVVTRLRPNLDERRRGWQVPITRSLEATAYFFRRLQHPTHPGCTLGGEGVPREMGNSLHVCRVFLGRSSKRQERTWSCELRNADERWISY
jgi:hypothetical protein